MGKGGELNRLEPKNSQYCQENAKSWFQLARWFNFIKKNSGENFGVSRAFAQIFDGQKVQIGSLQMEVNEQMVSKATGLPLTGEKWFKGKTFSYVDLNFFLLPEFKDP